MKKLLMTAVISVAALISTTAVAKDTITVVNHSNKASPATVFAKSFEEALRQQDQFNVEFYQASNCTDGDKKYNSTENAVMVFNADVRIASLAKGIACDNDATATNTTFITKSYLKFCRLPTTTKPFGETDTTVGIASVILSKGLFDDLNGGKRKLIGVPYSGSKTVLAAVLAGDVDYGIIGAGVVTNPEKEGKVQCIYDYDPRAENFVGKALPELKVPTLPIIQTIYHNSNNPAMAKVIAEAGNNAKFLDGIVYNGFNDTKNADITASDVKAVEDHVINVYENYWKTDEPGTFDKLIGTVKGWFK
jgi:ABC-type phosphate/phosphonate transport system substrate-binding protein